MTSARLHLMNGGMHVHASAGNCHANCTVAILRGVAIIRVPDCPPIRRAIDNHHSSILNTLRRCAPMGVDSMVIVTDQRTPTLHVNRG